MRTHSTTEEWRVIPGYSKYAASSLGRLRREVGSPHVQAGRVKHIGTVDGRKYRITRILRRRRENPLGSASILVALAFHGLRPAGRMAVNHKDGNKENNAPSNLEYVTYWANEQHAAANALKSWGEGHGMAKLNSEKVWFIRGSKSSTTELAAFFKVSKGAIRDVRHGRTWRHLV